LEVGLADARGLADKHEINDLRADMQRLLHHLELASDL
jgi:hypothetical protein